MDQGNLGNPPCHGFVFYAVRINEMSPFKSANT